MSDMDMDEFEATNFMLMEDNATMYDIIETPHNHDGVSYYHQQQQPEQYQSTIVAGDSNSYPINYNDDEEYDNNEHDNADNDELIKNNSHNGSFNNASNNDEGSLPDNVECLTNITKSDNNDNGESTTHKQLIA